MEYSDNGQNETRKAETGMEWYSDRGSLREGIEDTETLERIEVEKENKTNADHI